MMDPNRFLAGMIALVVVTLIAGALIGGAIWGHVDVQQFQQVPCPGRW